MDKGEFRWEFLVPWVNRSLTTTDKFIVCSTFIGVTRTLSLTLSRNLSLTLTLTVTLTLTATSTLTLTLTRYGKHYFCYNDLPELGVRAGGKQCRHVSADATDAWCTECCSP